MLNLTSEQATFLHQHLADMSNEDLLAALMNMTPTEMAAADMHDRCMNLPMITMDEAEQLIAEFGAHRSPWLGDDGQLIDQTSSTRYAWEDL